MRTIVRYVHASPKGLSEFTQQNHARQRASAVRAALLRGGRGVNGRSHVPAR